MRVKGCWTPVPIALAIAMILLTGCAAEISDHAACPPIAPYSAEAQARAAWELEALPAGTVIEGMLVDYHVLRRQAAACMG